MVLHPHMSAEGRVLIAPLAQTRGQFICDTLDWVCPVYPLMTASDQTVLPLRLQQFHRHRDSHDTGHPGQI